MKPNYQSLEEAKAILEAHYQVIGFAPGWTADLAIAICDALNCYVKTLDENDPQSTALYRLKFKCLTETIRFTKCSYGFQENNTLLFLSGPQSGTALFHDTKRNIRGIEIKMWAGAWSGIERQQFACYALSIPELRALTKMYTETLRPDNNTYIIKACAIINSHGIS